MNQFNDLVDTVAFTNTTTTADDDAAAALALATANIAEDDAADLYDASGFAFAPPYYHKDTGTIYNDDGLDRNGNSMPSSGNSMTTYDAAGFNMETPYYHKDTGTIYDSDGYDKYGNSQGGAATNPTWSAQAAFNSTYTTSDNISTTATATSSPSTNGINYTATGLPLGVSMNATGTISGSPDEAGDYEVTVTAKDMMDSTKSISATYNFSVTTPAATNPTWSAQAAFNSTYTTSDNISTTATATSSPSTNGINYTATGLPLGVSMNATGTISGSPDEAGDYECNCDSKRYDG